MLDNLTSNIKAWTSSAATKAGELTRAAANKAEELGKIGRLKMEVYQLERQEHRYLADLGRITHKLLQEDKAPRALAEEERVIKLIGKLDDVGSRIKAKQSDIEAATKVDKPAGAESKTAGAEKAQAKTAQRKPASPRKAAGGLRGAAKKTTKPGAGSKRGKTSVKSKAKAKA